MREMDSMARYWFSLGIRAALIGKGVKGFLTRGLARRQFSQRWRTASEPHQSEICISCR